MSDARDMADRWYSIQEAADRLGLPHDAVSRLVEQGDLPAVTRIGGEVRIPKPAFEFFVSGRTPTHRKVVRVRVHELPRFGAGEPSDPQASDG